MEQKRTLSLSGGDQASIQSMWLFAGLFIVCEIARWFGQTYGVVNMQHVKGFGVLFGGMLVFVGGFLIMPDFQKEATNDAGNLVRTFAMTGWARIFAVMSLVAVVLAFAVHPLWAPLAVLFPIRFTQEVRWFGKGELLQHRFMWKGMTRPKGEGIMMLMVSMSYVILCYGLMSGVGFGWGVLGFLVLLEIVNAVFVMTISRHPVVDANDDLAERRRQQELKQRKERWQWEQPVIHELNLLLDYMNPYSEPMYSRPDYGDMTMVRETARQLVQDEHRRIVRGLTAARDEAHRQCECAEQQLRDRTEERDSHRGSLEQVRARYEILEDLVLGLYLEALGFAKVVMNTDIPAQAAASLREERINFVREIFRLVASNPNLDPDAFCDLLSGQWPAARAGVMYVINVMGAQVGDDGGPMASAEWLNALRKLVMANTPSE